MISIITAIVAAMTGPPIFLYGTKSWQNLQVDLTSLTRGDQTISGSANSGGKLKLTVVSTTGMVAGDLMYLYDAEGEYENGNYAIYLVDDTTHVTLVLTYTGLITGVAYLKFVTALQKQVVYLDEPLKSSDDLKQGGYLEEKYPLSLLFLGKSEIDWTPAQHQVVIAVCRTLRLQFINKLQDHASVRLIENIETVEVINLFDAGLSGVIVTIEVTLFNTNTSCA